jgi:glycine oxidase
MSGRVGISVVIAGAGALGSCLALALTRAGARVTLLDPAPETSASAVAAGMIAPVFESLLDAEAGPGFATLRTAAALWDSLADSLGLVLDRQGAMAVGSDDDLERWAQLARRLGAPCERLGRRAAEMAVQGLSAPDGGLFTPLDVRLEPRAILAALTGAAGLTIQRVGVAGFTPGRAMLDDGEVVAADALIVATGAAQVLGPLAPELAALTPIKGQILRLAEGPRAGPMVRLARGYICPAAEGAIVGASMEPGRGDLHIDEAVTEGLLAQARFAFPNLDGTPAGVEAGVRAATPDGLPLLGRSSAPGVWIAGGARRNGWLLAPLIAQALAEAMVGDADLPPGLAGFDPRRFAPSFRRA